MTMSEQMDGLTKALLCGEQTCATTLCPIRCGRWRGNACSTISAVRSPGPAIRSSRMLLDETAEAGGAAQAAIVAPAAAAGPVGGAGQRRGRTRSITTTSTSRCRASLGRDPAGAAGARRERAAQRPRGDRRLCRRLRDRLPRRRARGAGSLRARLPRHRNDRSFGAAAACARLLRLDPAQTATALGIAGTQAAGLKSDVRHDVQAVPCRQGGAERAAGGAAGGARLYQPDRSGRMRAGFRRDARSGFRCRRRRSPTPPGGLHIRANLFKYHAACYLTHAPIECARADVARALTPYGSPPSTLRIDAGRPRLQYASPLDGLRGKFSLRQTVAMALAGVDTASLAGYSDTTAPDPALVALRERIAIEFREELAADRRRAVGRACRRPAGRRAPRFRHPRRRRRRAGPAPRRQIRQPGRAGDGRGARSRIARDDRRSRRAPRHRRPDAAGGWLTTAGLAGIFPDTIRTVARRQRTYPASRSWRSARCGCTLSV